MNKKNIIKYTLDIFLVIGFMLMYDKMAIGINLHEILGLGLGIGIIAHVLLNYKWIIAIGKKILLNDISNRTRFMYVINIILLICMLLITVGGILISKTILTRINSQNHGLWKAIHVAASNIAIIVIGIHVGLNLNWVRGMTKKIFGIKESKKYSQIISRVLIASVFLFGVYNISAQRFIQKTVMVFKVGNMHDIQNMGDRQSQPNRNNVEGQQEIPQKPEFNKDNMSEDEIKKFESNIKDRGNPPEMKGDLGKGKTSPITLVSNYLSILFVFTIITYYIDKFINMKKRTTEEYKNEKA